MRVLISVVAISVNAIRVCLGLLAALYKQQSIGVFEWRVAGVNQLPILIRIIKAGNRPLANLDLWFHYLNGNINLVGPKLLDISVADRLTKFEKQRFSVPPGIISPHSVMSRSGIAHTNEKSVAVDFSERATRMRRFQILVAALVQRVLGNARQDLSCPKEFTLFGVTMSNTTMLEAIRNIVSYTELDVSTAPTKKVAFVNADCVNKYVKNDAYKDALNQCQHVFADGIGLRIAARWHGARLADNVNGTDMFPLLCEELSRGRKRVFLYGGRKEVVNQVATRISKEFPGIHVVGVVDGYRHKSDSNAVCRQINRSKADIVFVAKGAPLQELWMTSNSPALNAKVVIGVGGLFDFYSGAVKRAPQWVREFSMEWVWRLVMQPTDKAKRYLLGTPLFLFRLLFSSRKSEQFSTVLEVC